MPSRRTFLGNAIALGVGAALGDTLHAAAEPEVRKIRLVHAPVMCLAPQYLAEDLLLIARGTDWRFLNEIKKELKA
jgi:hypothetical protein